MGPQGRGGTVAPARRPRIESMGSTHLQLTSAAIQVFLQAERVPLRARGTCVFLLLAALPTLAQPGIPSSRGQTAGQTVDWSGLPCEARFWGRKLGPAKVHYR
jgi:hypothetical protein